MSPMPRSVRSTTLARFLAPMCVLILLGATTDLHGQGVGLPLGTAAPGASLETLDGDAVQLLDYVEDGKPTLIEFWATWCENCEALQPQLDRIQAERGDAINVVAVAVAVAQSVRRVRRHLDEHAPGYPYLWDARGEAVRAYRAPTTSVVVILDAQGTVVYTGSGGTQDLTTEVDRVLGDKGDNR